MKLPTAAALSIRYEEETLALAGVSRWTERLGYLQPKRDIYSLQKATDELLMSF
jgi:hypothetical protein